MSLNHKDQEQIDRDYQRLLDDIADHRQWGRQIKALEQLPVYINSAYARPEQRIYRRNGIFHVCRILQHSYQVYDNVPKPPRYEPEVLEAARHALVQLKAELGSVELDDSDYRHLDLSGTKWEGKELDPANLPDEVKYQLEYHLHNTNLMGADLTGIDLSSVRLVGADFQGSKIVDANLSDSDCREVLFDEAVIERTSFYRADLRDSGFTGATLQKVDFRYGQFYYTEFQDGDYRNVDFEHADLAGAFAWDARFRGNFSKAKLDYIEANDSDFRKCRFIESSAKCACFDGSDFRDADFSGADLSQVMFQRAKLKGTDLSNANLSGAWFEGTPSPDVEFNEDYHGPADLAGANLEGALRPENDLQKWGWVANEDGRLRKV